MIKCPPFEGDFPYVSTLSFPLDTLIATTYSLVVICD